MSLTNDRIVIVDDDPYLVRILSMTIERAGYQTYKVLDSSDALLLIQETRPALVFLDVMMPDKDGYQLCRDIRNDTTLANQPYIIILTSRGSYHEEKRAKHFGADEFITKPFRPSYLVSRIREILE